MPLIVRPARRSDAKSMSEFLNELIVQGESTAHRQPFNADRIIDSYIDSKLGICCFSAVDDDEVIGFQALDWADPDWAGPDRLSPDWAIIATYVAVGRQGKGVGRKLFAATRAAARLAGVQRIDATIRRGNAVGQAYYDRIGFIDYRQGGQTISKKFQF